MYVCVCLGGSSCEAFADSADPSVEVQRPADHVRVRHQGQGHSGQGQPSPTVPLTLLGTISIFLEQIQHIFCKRAQQGDLCNIHAYALTQFSVK